MFEMDPDYYNEATIKQLYDPDEGFIVTTDGDKEKLVLGHVKGGNLPALEYMAKAGYPFDIRDEGGATLKELALKYNRQHIMTWLLARELGELQIRLDDYNRLSTQEKYYLERYKTAFIFLGEEDIHAIDVVTAPFPLMMSLLTFFDKAIDIKLTLDRRNIPFTEVLKQGNLLTLLLQAENPSDFLEDCNVDINDIATQDSEVWYELYAGYDSFLGKRGLAELFLHRSLSVRQFSMLEPEKKTELRKYPGQANELCEALLATQEPVTNFLNLSRELFFQVLPYGHCAAQFVKNGIPLNNLFIQDSIIRFTPWQRLIDNKAEVLRLCTKHGNFDYIPAIKKLMLAGVKLTPLLSLETNIFIKAMEKVDELVELLRLTDDNVGEYFIYQRSEDLKHFLDHSDIYLQLLQTDQSFESVKRTVFNKTKVMEQLVAELPVLRAYQSQGLRKKNEVIEQRKVDARERPQYSRPKPY